MTLTQHIADIIRAAPEGLTVYQIAAKLHRTPRQIGNYVSKAADYFGLERIPVRTTQHFGVRRQILYRAPR